VSCLGTALRAGVAAQALRDYRAVPALGTINRASDRARAVLFRVVSRAANRVRPIWNSIDATAQGRPNQGAVKSDACKQLGDAVDFFYNLTAPCK
jgi:hypothetical protein